jgi:hypothetical protein
MRVVVGLLVGVLLLIAFAGLGVGVVFIIQAVDNAPGTDLQAQILSALVVGAVPFGIGTIALGAAVVTLAVDHARTEIIGTLQAGPVRFAAPQPSRLSPAPERAPDRNVGDWR